MQLALRPAGISKWLWRIVATLAAAHVLGQTAHWGFGRDSVFGLVPLFDLNAEVNVPTFYSSLTLAGCALLMGLLAWVRWQRKVGGALHWAGLAAVMLFLALDEFASLHERLSEPVRDSLGVGGVLTSAWVLPYGVAGLLLLVMYVPFLLSLPARTRSLIVLGGLTFVLGAVGLEMLAGPAKEAAAGSPSLAITLFTTLEELLEMAGVVICVHGLTAQLATEAEGLEFRLLPEDALLEEQEAPGGELPRDVARGWFGRMGSTRR